MVDIVQIDLLSPPFAFVTEDVYLGGLIHSPAEVIRQVLIDLGLGTLPSGEEEWPVYATNEGGTKDQAITVLDQTGLDDGRWMPTGEATVHHGLQILVRSLDHQTGYRRASRVREAVLRTVRNRAVTVEGVDYTVPCVTRVGPILPLGKDAPVTGRSRFSLNCQSPLYRTQS